MHLKPSNQNLHIILIVAGIALLFALAVFVPLSSTASAPSFQQPGAPQVQYSISSVTVKGASAVNATSEPA